MDRVMEIPAHLLFEIAYDSTGLIVASLEVGMELGGKEVPFTPAGQHV